MPTSTRRCIEDAARARSSEVRPRPRSLRVVSLAKRQIVAAHAAAIAEAQLPRRLRPGFTQPTLAARQLATLDRLSEGRVAVHIITGGLTRRWRGTGTRGEGRPLRADKISDRPPAKVIRAKPGKPIRPILQGQQAYSVIKPSLSLSLTGGSSEEAIDVAGRHADVYAFWGETLAQVEISRDKEVRSSAARLVAVWDSACPCVRSSRTPKSARGSAPTKSWLESAICESRRGRR